MTGSRLALLAAAALTCAQLACGGVSLGPTDAAAEGGAAGGAGGRSSGSAGAGGFGGVGGFGGGGIGGVGGSGGHGGATGLGGAGGAGGLTGGGGSDGGTTGHGGAGGAPTDAGADRGPTVCGSAMCAAGTYCCNASCNLCAPLGAACIQIACAPDASIIGDASACVAEPAQDSSCAADGPMHLYRCILTELPPPCAVRSIGNVTNTFCCP